MKIHNNSEKIFSSLYDTENMRKIIGENFVGPEKLNLNDQTLIALFEKEDNGDFQDVALYTTLIPVVFFSIKVFPGKNSRENKEENGFEIITEGGCDTLEWLVKTAKLIREGVVSIKTAKLIRRG